MLDYLLATLSKCQGGVQRVHIIDGTVDGSLLLELFTRDGAGTMIARYSKALLPIFFLKVVTSLLVPIVQCLHYSVLVAKGSHL